MKLLTMSILFLSFTTFSYGQSNTEVEYRNTARDRIEKLGFNVEQVKLKKTFHPIMLATNLGRTLNGMKNIRISDIYLSNGSLISCYIGEKLDKGSSGNSIQLGHCSFNVLENDNDIWF